MLFANFFEREMGVTKVVLHKIREGKGPLRRHLRAFVGDGGSGLQERERGVLGNAGRKSREERSVSPRHPIKIDISRRPSTRKAKRCPQGIDEHSARIDDEGVHAGRAGAKSSAAQDDGLVQVRTQSGAQGVGDRVGATRIRSAQGLNDVGEWNSKRFFGHKEVRHAIVIAIGVDDLCTQRGRWKAEGIAKRDSPAAEVVTRPHMKNRKRAGSKRGHANAPLGMDFAGIEWPTRRHRRGFCFRIEHEIGAKTSRPVAVAAQRALMRVKGLARTPT